MIVRGMDFTSRPSRRKPITCANCDLSDEELVTLGFSDLTSFDQFEKSIGSSGQWIAGLDFPFGQSRTLVKNLGWPNTWEAYVELIGRMSRPEFLSILERYRTPRSKGDKEHLRTTDIGARSKSPQKCCNPPVALMFLEGAPRLRVSLANILPVRQTYSSAIIVEAYPAIVARRWTNGQSYKTDTKKKQTIQKAETRRRIVAGLQSPEFRTIYGFGLRLNPESRDRLINDPAGDQLDAVLCATQAAWAFGHRTNGYGIPKDADPVEGWIVDPSLEVRFSNADSVSGC
jgi:Protein of unknown function (DUF429)